MEPATSSSAGIASWATHEATLKRKLGSGLGHVELGIGAAPPPVRKLGLMMRDLYRAVEADYIANLKDVKNLKLRWTKHLDPVFGEKAVSEVRHESIFLYTEHRREQGAAPDEFHGHVFYAIAGVK